MVVRNIFILAVLLFSKESFAQEYELSNKRYEIKISQDNSSRISVVRDRIKKLYGKSSDFSLESDQELGMIYVIPKGDKPFNLSFTTEKGEVQDLRLLPQSNLNGENIIFKKVSKSSDNRESEIVNVINLAHKLDLYDLSEEERDLGDFSLAPYGYRNFKQYKVKVYRLTNKSSQMQQVQVEHFKFSGKLVATAIDNSLYLGSGETGMLYVVEVI